MAHGEINHIEIPYDDEERAKRFYGGVFGWTFSQVEGFDAYDLFTSGPGGLGGALGKRGESAGETTGTTSSSTTSRPPSQGDGARRHDHRPEDRHPGPGLVRGRHRQRGQRAVALREPSGLTFAASDTRRIGDNPPVRLIDSHCHLQADRFDDDVDLVLGGARLAGVERILVPGWNPASPWRR